MSWENGSKENIPGREARYYFITANRHDSVISKGLTVIYLNCPIN